MKAIVTVPIHPKLATILELLNVLGVEPNWVEENQIQLTSWTGTTYDARISILDDSLSFRMAHIYEVASETFLDVAWQLRSDSEDS